jgi:hypothetical protein
MPVRPRLPENKTPWPMKWVALAILVFIAIYTPLMLKFRKPGHGYEPAAEAERRMAEAAKWAKIEARLEMPVAGAVAPPTPSPAAAIADAPTRLPEGLRDALAGAPALPAEITAVTAPAACGAGEACVINFTGVLASADERLAGVTVFQEGGRIFVLPLTVPSLGGSRARTADAAARVTLPAGALKPGSYTVIVAASARAKQWTLEVK